MGSRVVLSESILPTPRGWGGVGCSYFLFLLVGGYFGPPLGLWLEREV